MSMKFEDLSICVIFGGQSNEHEISAQSASYIINLLKEANAKNIYQLGISKEGNCFLFHGRVDQVKDGSWLNDPNNQTVLFKLGEKGQGFYVEEDNQLNWYDVDVFFPVLHGQNGEDGTIQGLFDMLNANFVGCGVLSSAVSMDKVISRMLFDYAGIPQAEWTWLKKKEYLSNKDKAVENIEAELAYPVFVKPANAGSSVGINKAYDRKDLENSLDLAFNYDSKVVIEAGIIGREIELAIIEDPDLEDNIFVSEAGEIIPDRDFYDYESKYISQDSELIIPASLTDDQLKTLHEYAKTAFNLVDGEGLSRADFFIEKSTGKILLNEINTLPGFTAISMYPKLIQHSGYNPIKLIKTLINSAIN
ncbi:MAG: D-alanine--D-alanine ligase [Clostridiaceae bacterium]|nr:D-alanine--D-alanine ligase [Clostridiaceae bacterium]